MPREGFVRVQGRTQGRVWGRIALAAAWIVTQLALVATAGLRADHAFGFRMFNESSTIRLHLLRRVEAPSGHGTVLVDAPGGAWTALDRAGAPRRFAWSDRVREPALSAFDRTIHASYGGAAQLARLEAALADVAAHVSDDAETRGLELRVTVRRNGAEPHDHSFAREIGHLTPSDARP